MLGHCSYLTSKTTDASRDRGSWQAPLILLFKNLDFNPESDNRDCPAASCSSAGGSVKKKGDAEKSGRMGK